MSHDILQEIVTEEEYNPKKAFLSPMFLLTLKLQGKKELTTVAIFLVEGIIWWISIPLSWLRNLSVKFLFR